MGNSGLQSSESNRITPEFRQACGLKLEGENGVVAHSERGNLPSQEMSECKGISVVVT